jgi:hypothetical protein
MSKDNKKSINEGLFGTARKFTDAFFDGLKANAINNALANAKKSERLPAPIVNKMVELDAAAKELKKMLKDLED